MTGQRPASALDTLEAMIRCDTPERCARIEEVYGHTVTHLTVRKVTAEERSHVGDFWATGKPMKAKKYVIVDDEGNYLGAFGMVDGGNTRAETVFWAERWASKNGGHLIRPVGWENVVGALP